MAKETVGLSSYIAIRANEVGRLEQGWVYLLRINETFNINKLCTLQSYFIKVFLVNDYKLPGLILIAFDDIFVLQGFTCYFVFLLIRNRIVPFLRKKIKAD